MSIEQANTLLDKVREGARYPQHTILMALFIIGEIDENQLEQLNHE